MGSTKTTSFDFGIALVGLISMIIVYVKLLWDIWDGSYLLRDVVWYVGGFFLGAVGIVMFTYLLFRAWNELN